MEIDLDKLAAGELTDADLAALPPEQIREAYRALSARFKTVKETTKEVVAELTATRAQVAKRGRKPGSSAPGAVRSDVASPIEHTMVAPADAKLSTQEFAIARDLACGLTNREIGDRLGVSVKTVDTHRGHVLDKLNARNNSDVTRWAIRWGYVRVDGTYGAPPPDTWTPGPEAWPEVDR